ncbi:glycosyl hydrolase [Allostella humosa]|uniref:beta-N-acetylhexosaminidase n=1 Tax=Stella humosa TaxID=94 RepID=UPI0011341E5F|nr:beta-N-acetylhexosaminidase [Stella humosa]BBK30884.1 glycosyl hydrolase [Stella humosa]
MFGCAGTSLSGQEAAFFAEARPLGFILFRRNIETPDQVRRLTAALRRSIGNPQAPVLIDQEGGRVARLRPPHWPEFPAARRFGDAWARDPERAVEAVRANSRLLAATLLPLGITIDCMPVLDLPVPGSHDVIGDRAYSDDPMAVAQLGLAAAEGLLEGGVLPVVKHIPGHGRAGVDSHLELPVVAAPEAELMERDFAPFRALRYMPLGMTAHVRYLALDAARPATLSPVVLGEFVRDRIGFAGLLFSDDLSMQALPGAIEERAAACIAAGCDVALHCNGNMDEMVRVAAAVPAMSRHAARRWSIAEDIRRRGDPTADPERLANWRDLMLLDV